VIIRNNVVFPAPFAAWQREGHVVHEQQVAVPLPDTAGFDHDVAEPRAGRNVDLDLFDSLSGVLFQQVFIRIQSCLTLGLPRPRRHPDPLELALERTLALRFLLLFERQAVLLLLEP
jgi:hypothetical protein